jgi:hypothetical protein
MMIVHFNRGYKLEINVIQQYLMEHNHLLKILIQEKLVEMKIELTLQQQHHVQQLVVVIQLFVQHKYVLMLIKLFLKFIKVLKHLIYVQEKMFLLLVEWIVLYVYGIHIYLLDLLLDFVVIMHLYFLLK